MESSALEERQRLQPVGGVDRAGDGIVDILGLAAASSPRTRPVAGSVTAMAGPRPSTHFPRANVARDPRIAAFSTTTESIARPGPSRSVPLRDPRMRRGFSCYRRRA